MIQLSYTTLVGLAALNLAGYAVLFVVAWLDSLDAKGCREIAEQTRKTAEAAIRNAEQRHQLAQREMEVRLSDQTQKVILLEESKATDEDALAEANRTIRRIGNDNERLRLARESDRSAYHRLSSDFNKLRGVADGYKKQIEESEEKLRKIEKMFRGYIGDAKTLASIASDQIDELVITTPPDNSERTPDQPSVSE